MTVRMVCIDPRVDPLWLRLVQRVPSVVFHSPEWLQVLGDTYQLPIQAHVLVDEEGIPHAGLPFGRISDMMGERTVSLPFSDYCDPLVSNADEWNTLITPLLDEHHSMVIRPLHSDVPSRDERFTLWKRAKWHGKDLTPDLDILWRSIDESSRRAIRKAQAAGVSVQVATQPEMLRVFFMLHLRLRKYKYSLLAQPYGFFDHIWRLFLAVQKGVLLLATHNGEIIAGTLFLEWQDTLYYKFNASTRDDLAYRPNDLLTWEGIKYAKTKGYTYLDLGLSDWDQEGLIRYKRKFATNEQTISFLRYTAGGEPDPREIQQRALLAHLTNLFTDVSVPDPITAKAGESLYRFFV